MNIVEIKNENNKEMPPIKERQDVFIPDIKNLAIPRRNGFVSVYSGSGGSGKTSLLLNLFKQRDAYRGKFHNLYYICPASSFLSVAKHPFEKHDKVFHELTPELLNDIYAELNAKKEEWSKPKKKPKKVFEGEEKPEEEEPAEIEYSCIIIDDFANVLKDKHLLQVLNKMIIKSRHICLSWIFTVQSFYYLPKILRKQLTNAIIFKPKNVEEWGSMTKELFNMNKDDALQLFNYIFDEPYAHADLDLVESKYFKNWNLLEIERGAKPPI